MPYPNSNTLNIIIPQTSASIDTPSSQAPFVERIISGSRLVLQTDTTGTLIGSSDLNVNNITASNITASGYISASNLYVRTNITDAGSLTVVGASTFSGMVSASGGLTSSASNIGTLTVVGNSILSTVFATNITSSNISASGNISSSTLYVVSNAIINGNINVNGNSILGDSFNDVNTSSGSLKVLNTTNATSYTDTGAALQVDGGARIGRDTWISGSLNVAGDLTIFGSSSVVYISSSTVIINDNIIQLNAFFPFERYAGIEVFDSGSNQRSASLLWDGNQDNWITVDQNNSASNIVLGPTSSFSSDIITGFTANRIPKAYDATGITDSLISDDATTLRYNGTTISSSIITANTGSFTALTVVTGSSPGVGLQVPAHPTASGMPGQIEVDNNFIYVYTNNIWKRVPLSTWSL
jgi:hypothetical protein